MKCVVVCDKRDPKQESTSKAAVTAQRLHGKGHTVAYLRVEHWINTNWTDVDPNKYGEVHVLVDGLEVPIELGIYERTCKVELTEMNYMTLGIALADVLDMETKGCCKSDLLELDDLLKMAVTSRVNKLKRTPVLCYVSGEWCSLLPDILLVDLGDGLFTPAGAALCRAVLECVGGPADDVTVLCQDKTLLQGDKFLRSLRVEQWTNVQVPGISMNRAVRVGLAVDQLAAAAPFYSVEQALRSAGKDVGASVELVYIHLNKLNMSLLGDLNGIVMPGGFGSAFLDEKLKIIRYARENKIPFLGICLGFQLAVIEFTRNVLGVVLATSEEFDPRSSYTVVKKITRNKCGNTGRDMFLGCYDVEYRGAGKQIYGSQSWEQRFRHRYAVDGTYARRLEECGMNFCGKTADGRLSMFVLEEHPFFCGVQYHPELDPSVPSVDPVFMAFISSTINN